ncbi:hypothetical protein M422DRAFT_27252 [Sphaerobolus stellatus SS14]|nr:hypothetical protein M422DRAFT_27252 [Sphaerobolus stellatus SS14]
MSNSNGYSDYHTSSRRNLSSIRDIIVDVLEQPATPRRMIPGPFFPYFSSRSHQFPPDHHRTSGSGGGGMDVFVTSNQGLVHQRSSDRDDFRQVSKEEAISMSTGRHACPESHRCPWPGCGKSFSVSSNIRRHYRGHTREDGGQSS